MIMTALTGMYRAWPFRPHCNSRAGIHAWPCRIVGMLVKGEPQVPDCKHRK